MIAKYIRCTVPVGQQDAFSQGQRRWQETALSHGFISQHGGWEQATGKAIILARWADMESVKNFMASAHDPIADKTRQVGTYTAISVSYLQQVMQIPVSVAPIPEKAASTQVDAGFIRIADCYIAADKVDQFILEQDTLWNPGMQQVEGMLGGELWRFNDEVDHYLVTSYWQSESHHNHYVSEHFPALKQQAANNIIQTMSGQSIPTEQSWQIVP
ncbi:DUF4937 domain-containing protein [Shewanella sp. VB17]|uniref:DUF4937 domain-containing protein n=1 Tax=Shewanella sp. VB17 TaxID=2739432 RepID=UPI001566C05E|nr:DUF4937 domain-containing protein [Shewanella sp. VB17]NRD72000.1 DUF4937 domain-containing protein [Shewanella sp. VB17]